MATDLMTIFGFFLTIFGCGVAVGRLVARIERYLDEKENEKHVDKRKNDRR